MRHFFRYYWTLSKHFGYRVWDTRGRELLSALLLAVVTFVVSVVFKQVDALTAFEIAIVALVLWLSVFAVGHLIHAPVLLHDNNHHMMAREQKWGFGVFGIFVMGLIVASVTAIATYIWVDRTPTITMATADPGALRPIIEVQKQKIAALTARVPDERSLKVRATQLAIEYQEYWKKQPRGPTCHQDSKMTPQQQGDAMKPCMEFMNEQSFKYQQLYAPKVMSIIAEFKAKGANVLNIENCASTGFCGIDVSVQLKALSEQLDAHDNLKGLGCSS